MVLPLFAAAALAAGAVPAAAQRVHLPAQQAPPGTLALPALQAAPELGLNGALDLAPGLDLDLDLSAPELGLDAPALGALRDAKPADRRARGARLERVSRDLSKSAERGEERGFLDGFFDNSRRSQAIVDPLSGEDFAREIDEPYRRLVAAGINATITVYGSARVGPRSRAYRDARAFGRRVAEASGGRIAVVTGGGPGIMEAANRGAFEAGGPSIGYNITLPHEQEPNPYTTPGLDYTFRSFEARKLNMRRTAVAHVYYDGGFGTMDELFEILTLMQTGKLHRAPVVLVAPPGRWNKVFDARELKRRGLISPEDLDLIHYVPDADAAWKAIEGFREPAPRVNANAKR